ncbi:pantoate--beta-alanine ligase [Corynebacterium uterequi]|uniref:pantoate--beta-alanine ligase (AMP-forming) n=1 Tax=Corynebacterium uterequi TaxID=1072256 RepID=A0A0G3HGI7_9CORY|nr:pantoate--beta-alanine ligase [Corynebacterium uterequi]AKK11870.1 panthothenate synthetase [Corynebacterium uterequi]
MSFEFGAATVIDDLARMRMLGSAMRKTGRPVVLVPLGRGLHAGHIALIRAARMLPRAVVVVAWQGDDIPAALADEHVDVVWPVRDEDLWPSGAPTLSVRWEGGLEPAGVVEAEVTRGLALMGVLRPSDVIVGEKDFEVAAALRRAIADLHMGVEVHGVPTVRMPDGVAISLRNADVDPSARTDATVISAALTAGAFAAEHGPAAVLKTASEVLAAGGITPDYLELRGLGFGPAPEVGDARLVVAATVGGVRLIDNVGVPLGIGFHNLGDDAT